LYFWEYAAAGRGRGRPWIEPHLQEGTTPLVKKMAGKATRDFTNFHYDTFDEQSYRGARAMVDGDWKLVLSGDRTELFNVRLDPAESENIAAREPERVRGLTERLRSWQGGVLRSLAGGDYQQ
jgi:arylsulfatase A-like enzyme